MTQPTRNDSPPRNTQHAPPSFHDRLRQWSQLFLNPIARLIGRTGLTPNTLTIVGLALNVGVAAVLARGSIVLGGILLLLASSFDALDGTLARLTGQQSRFGAFFDSTLDRYSEGVIYGGLLIYYLDQGVWAEPLLLYAAIIGSQMVSYTRARAEGLGLECKVGLATRLERLLILAAGLILSQVTLALGLVAVLANLTAVQRMLYVHKVTQESESRL